MAKKVKRTTSAKKATGKKKLKDLKPVKSVVGGRFVDPPDPD
jgi:hypothetical protein